MATLLRLGGFEDWAASLDSLAEEVAGDPPSASAGIRSLYGGMGSLNDIVLHSRGTPLSHENDEFDALRRKLYELCE